MPAARWHFVMHRDSKGAAWTWRRVHVDGSIERTSEPHTDYGRAVNDAVRNGFQPDRDSWVLVAGEACTHFGPGQKPATIPPDTASGLRQDVPTLQGNEKLRRLRLLSRKAPAPTETPPDAE